MRIGYNIRKKYEFVKAYFICIYLQKSLVPYRFSFVYSNMRYGENMKNLVENAFGDIVERTDYGNHRNQIAIDFGEYYPLSINGLKPKIRIVRLTQDLIQVNAEIK